VEGAAKLVIGLVFIALFIQLVKRGPGGAGEWFRAKFLGQPGAPTPAEARALAHAEARRGRELRGRAG
jgi:hypothetical protein